MKVQLISSHWLSVEGGVIKIVFYQTDEPGIRLFNVDKNAVLLSPDLMQEWRSIVAIRDKQKAFFDKLIRVSNTDLIWNQKNNNAIQSET